MMRKDIRGTALFAQAEALCQAVLRPGAGLICDASELTANGTHAIFAGTVIEALNGAPATRICRTDLATGDTHVLTFGPHVDRSPEFSPDGRQIAFLSDRHRAGEFQLYLLDPVSSAVRSTPRVEGWVEYLHWSPDGKKILLGVAGHGADVAGGQGAIASRQAAADLPTWMPAVDNADESYRWRSMWVYELAADSVRQVPRAGSNVWEAVWCGDEALAAVVSAGPNEGLWYTARLDLIAVRTGASREIYAPQDQLGWPAASPSGKYLSVVEAVCSDRWLAAGDLWLIEMQSGANRRVDTGGVDISCAVWCSEHQLLLAGHRGFETVVGLVDVVSGTFTEVWRSREVTTGGRYARVAALAQIGDCVLVGESFTRAPEVAVIRGGQYKRLKSFDAGYADQAAAIEAVECITWKAPDGLQIEGWLLRPRGGHPYPLVMNIHGGPVWHWRPTWLGRARTLPILLLIRRGYAVFLPNPRGSGGRGQDFARKVKGDMNGADTHDFLSGLDSLVERGIADAARMGVTGVSYGGSMTAWLITRDSRFAAAVPVCPHTNQTTGHLLSNIPDFVSLFLADTYTNSGGKYLERSPVMYAQKVTTPTLNICGALDRCTPPEEAVQFHHALLENGVKSVLVTYPEEGHGVQRFPATIDFAARLVSWFEEHMPATRPGE